MFRTSLDRDHRGTRPMEREADRGGHEILFWKDEVLWTPVSMVLHSFIQFVQLEHSTPVSKSTVTLTYREVDEQGKRWWINWQKKKVGIPDPPFETGYQSPNPDDFQEHMLWTSAGLSHGNYGVFRRHRPIPVTYDPYLAFIQPEAQRRPFSPPPGHVIAIRYHVTVTRQKMYQK